MPRPDKSNHVKSLIVLAKVQVMRAQVQKTPPNRHFPRAFSPTVTSHVITSRHFPRAKSPSHFPRASSHRHFPRAYSLVARKRVRTQSQYFLKGAQNKADSHFRLNYDYDDYEYNADCCSASVFRKSERGVASARATP